MLFSPVHTSTEGLQVLCLERNISIFHADKLNEKAVDRALAKLHLWH